MITKQEYFDTHFDPEFAKKVFGIDATESSITFPIYDENRKLLFSKYRHLIGAAKFSADKGSYPALFAIHKIKNMPWVILCEGEPDCVRLWQQGFPAVTGTTGVKAFNSNLADPLKGKTVYICLDSDEAGQKEVQKYCRVLKEADSTPLVIDLPKQYKDICEFFVAGNTKTDFEALIQKALPIDEWLDKNEPEDFGFEEGTELLKRELPPEEWLVDRVLPFDGFTFIFGAEATGKSFYTLTLANSVATGTAWLNAIDKEGNPIFSVKSPQKVLIIDKENTKQLTQSRLKSLNISGKNIFWLKYPYKFDLNDPEQESGLSEFAQAAARKVEKHNIQLIIIDSFTDVMLGNENASGDVQAFFDTFRQLFPGRSILALHHAPKPAQNVTRTSAQKARGSTNITAQISSGFYVEALAKSRSEFILEQTKARSAEKLNKFLVELQVEPDPENRGKTIVTEIKYKGEIEQSDLKISEAEAFIEDCFKKNAILSRKDLIELCTSEGISKGTMGRVITQMIKDDLIDSIPDPNNKSKRNYIWSHQEEGIDYEPE